MANTLDYIPQGVEDVMAKYGKYYQQKGAEDLMREGLVSRRRTSDLLPEQLSKYNLEYGLGQQMGMANLSMQGAGVAQQEANVWGGLSPFTGATLTGQNPWAASEAEKGRTFQAGQSEIMRAWEQDMKQKEWDAQREMSERQAGANIWQGIFGGAGSLIGGWLGGL